MQPIRAIVRRYKSTHIAHQEKLARPRAEGAEAAGKAEANVSVAVSEPPS